MNNEASDDKVVFNINESVDGINESLIDQSRKGSQETDPRFHSVGQMGSFKPTFLPLGRINEEDEALETNVRNDSIIEGGMSVNFIRGEPDDLIYNLIDNEDAADHEKTKIEKAKIKLQEELDKIKE
jgi:hypothetical protein